MMPDAASIAANFAIAGRIVDVRSSSGHINDSFVLTCEDVGERAGAAEMRILLQRINTHVFPDPVRLMENIHRVTMHIAGKLQARGVCDWRRRVLTLIATRAGGVLHRDDSGGYWRAYAFIEGTCARLAVQTPAEAECAARAFGEFQAMLADLPGPPLHEVIAGFHDTPSRLVAFDAAVAADPQGRAGKVAEEIAAINANRSLARMLVDLHAAGKIPTRITHNDCKMSNVLFDDASGAALCVVDLDTVMPGLALYDFGDMVRSMATRAPEDEPDASKVSLEPPLFEGLVRGYLSATGTMLNDAERAHLVTAGMLITYEQAIRFLTDYLLGDVYYKTAHPSHNLDRARSQLALLRSMQDQELILQEIANTGADH